MRRGRHLRFDAVRAGNQNRALASLGHPVLLGVEYAGHYRIATLAQKLGARLPHGKHLGNLLPHDELRPKQIRVAHRREHQRRAGVGLLAKLPQSRRVAVGAKPDRLVHLIQRLAARPRTRHRERLARGAGDRQLGGQRRVVVVVVFEHLPNVVDPVDHAVRFARGAHFRHVVDTDLFDAEPLAGNSPAGARKQIHSLHADALSFDDEPWIALQERGFRDGDTSDFCEARSVAVP